MGKIVLTRIDDRLIHGQVTAACLRAYPSDSIYVVDDQVAKNDFLKTVLKITASSGIKVEAMTVNEALKILKDENNKERIMIITKRPHAIVGLVKGGVKIGSINVGGMQPKAASTKRISKAVSVAKEDIDDFHFLAERGIKIEIRMVPTDIGVNLVKLI